MGHWCWTCPASTCCSGCASTGWSKASSTLTPVTRYCVLGSPPSRRRIRPGWRTEPTSCAPSCHRPAWPRSGSPSWPGSCAAWRSAAASWPAPRSATSTRWPPTSRSAPAAATRSATPTHTLLSTGCCRAPDRWPSGTRRTERPTRCRRSGCATACWPSPARCAISSAARSGCRSWRPSSTRSSPTSRGRASTTTAATTPAWWRSTPTCPTGCPGCPRWVAHETYPGHHTEHCRKDQRLVATGGRLEHTIFLVNTPECLMAEGLADLGVPAALGPGWGRWAQEIYADLGLSFDGELAEAVAEAVLPLDGVRQDAALMLHDYGWGEDEVVTYLQRWALVPADRARQSLRFLTDPLWRAYITTYVEGRRLLGTWLEARPTGQPLVERYTRLLDEPLTPARIRAEVEIAAAAAFLDGEV